MRNLKWLFFSIPLVLFCTMVFFFVRALGSDPSLLPSARLNQPIPDFSLPALADSSRLLAPKDLKGPLLLNVWATWCPSCQLEHPMLKELARGGIPIAGLNYKDERQAAQKYLAIHDDPYVFNIFDASGSLGLDLGVYGAPETFLIDGEGVIRYRHVGVISPEVWRNLLWPKWQALGAAK